MLKLQVEAVLHIEVLFVSEPMGATIQSTLYEFGARRWVDVDPERKFRERAGPVGIDTEVETTGNVGKTRLVVFRPKSLRAEIGARSPVIHVFDNWTTNDAWLCVLSVPHDAAMLKIRIRDFEGKVLPVTLGIGEDERLCYYFFLPNATALRIEGEAIVDSKFYKRVRGTIGRVASSEDYNSLQQARTATWLLREETLTMVEDPPGIRWTTSRAAKLARDLESMTERKPRAWVINFPWTRKKL